MRDHPRILGMLFIVWAAVQVGAALGLSSMQAEPSGAAVVFWLVLLAVAAAYALVGMRLRRRDPRIRPWAIALSAVALLSFPLGTAVGVYGLWVLLQRRELKPA